MNGKMLSKHAEPPHSAHKYFLLPVLTTTLKVSVHMSRSDLRL